MGGPCVDRSRPPHQRRVARDHAAGMVGDEAACRSARKFASTYFKHLPNALDETLCDPAQTNIHHLVLLVIAVFMLMYLGLGYVRLVLV